MTVDEELAVVKEQLSVALAELSAYQELEDTLLTQLIEIVDEYREDTD